MQNIGASNADDAFYRYKMPKLVAKVEGRGNGIKTNIVNNVDVAKALARSPEYTLKYFGCELGAQTNFDAKTGVSIVNGAHDSKKLIEILEGFIKKFVQCYSCGNPETVIKIKKEFLHLKCKACGHVSDIDPRHKLNTFILKNPPENKLSKEERRLKNVEEERLKGAEDGAKKEKKKKDKSEKTDKKDKKKKKDKEDGEGGDEHEGDDAEGKGEQTESASDDADDGVVWMTDTSEEAIRKRAEEQLTLATAAMVTQGNIEAEAERKAAAEKAAAEQAAKEAAAREAEQAAKQAAEAKAAEDARLAAEAQRLALEAAAVPTGDANVQALRALVSERSGDVAAFNAELRKLNVEGGLVGKARVLVEAVLGSSDEKLGTLLKTHKALFAASAKDPPGQLALLVAFEHFVVVTAPERAKETAVALKAMYDLDLVDEDVIVGWAGKQDAGKLLGVPVEGARAVRKAAAPVVEWLQQEEEDDEDDDEDEDDE